LGSSLAGGFFIFFDASKSAKAMPPGGWGLSSGPGSFGGGRSSLFLSFLPASHSYHAIVPGGLGLSSGPGSLAASGSTFFLSFLPASQSCHAIVPGGLGLSSTPASGSALSTFGLPKLFLNAFSSSYKNDKSLSLAKLSLLSLLGIIKLSGMLFLEGYGSDAGAEIGVPNGTPLTQQ
jgi:hypothetical protein